MRNFKRLALSLCLSPLMLGLAAWAVEGQLTSIQFNTQSQSLVMTNSAPVTASVNSVNIGRTKRIIIDLDNAEVGVGIPRDAQLLQQLSRQWPTLKNVSVNQFGGSKPIVRILLDIDGIDQTAALTNSRGTQLELRLGSPLAYKTPPAMAVPENSVSAESISSAEMKQTLVLLNQKYDQLVSENQTLKSQLQQASQARQSSDYDATELQRLRESQLSLTEQLKKQTGDAQRLKSQLDQLQGKFTALQNQQRVTTTAPASVPNSQLDEMKKQVDAAREALGKSITTINEQNKEIANLKKQMESVSASSELTSRDQMTLLNNKLDEKEATIRNLQAQLDQQRVTHLQENATPTAIGSDRSADATREQLENMRNQYKTLVTEYNRLKADPSEKGTLFAENDTLKAKQKELEKRLNEQTDLAEKRKREYDALWKESQANKAAAKPVAAKPAPDLKPELDRLTREKSDLESQVADLKQQLAAPKPEPQVQSQTSSAKSDTKLVAENKRLTDVVALMKKDNQLMAEDREKSDQELKSVKAQLSAIKKQSGIKKADPVETDPAIAAKVQQLEQEALQLKSSLQTLEDENIRLQKASEGNSGDNEKMLQQQLAETRARLADMDTRYKKILGEYDKLSQQKTTAAKPIKAAPAASQDVQKLQAQVKQLNADLASARTQNSSEAEKHFHSAQSFENANQLDMAFTEYAKAVEQDPDNGRYVAALGAALASQQKYGDSIQLLKGYLAKHPERLEIHSQLGKVYTLNNQTDEAKKSFGEALSVSTLNNYATTLKKLGQTEQAEGLFKLALTIDPGDSEVLFNLGNLYNGANKLPEALGNYNKALSIRPDFAEAHYNVGLVYSKMGDAGQAASHLERFLQLSPNAANADSVRAYIKKLKGA